MVDDHRVDVPPAAQHAGGPQRRPARRDRPGRHRPRRRRRQHRRHGRRPVGRRRVAPSWSCRPPSRCRPRSATACGPPTASPASTSSAASHLGSRAIAAMATIDAETARSALGVPEAVGLGGLGVAVPAVGDRAVVVEHPGQVVDAALELGLDRVGRRERRRPRRRPTAVTATDGTTEVSATSVGRAGGGVRRWRGGRAAEHRRRVARAAPGRRTTRAHQPTPGAGAEPSGGGTWRQARPAGMELPQEEIAAGPLTLRPTDERDIDDVALACDDEAAGGRSLPLLPSPYTRADAEWWVPGGRAGPLGGRGRPSSRSSRTAGSSARSASPATTWPTTWWRSATGWPAGPGVGASPRPPPGPPPSGPSATARAGSSCSRRGRTAASQRVALAAGFRHEGVRRAAGRGRDGEPPRPAGVEPAAGRPARPGSPRLPRPPRRPARRRGRARCGPADPSDVPGWPRRRPIPTSGAG